MNPNDLKSTNPLGLLAAHGQSVWLDYIRRSLLTSGELQRMIDQDGLRGVTSNPAIFEKAIAGGTEYAEVLAADDAGANAKSRYERLAIRDIQDAADILRPLYTRTSYRDGYVSLEVSPYLARDTESTLEEARRLWAAVDRPNVMIKVPATPEGIPAIRALIADGINVNITLLFSQAAYEAVAEAYIAGLEALATRGGDLSRVASVASFFISRIDTAIDAQIAPHKIKCKAFAEHIAKIQRQTPRQGLQIQDPEQFGRARVSFQKTPIGKMHLQFTIHARVIRRADGALPRHLALQRTLGFGQNARLPQAV